MSESETISVKVDRALLKELSELIEGRTGYRPSHREIIDKAMSHDIERMERPRKKAG